MATNTNAVWYPVHEAYPPDDLDMTWDESSRSVKVLVWTASGEIRAGYYKWYRDFQCGWVDDSSDNYPIENVTHWTWLPLGPADASGPPFVGSTTDQELESRGYWDPI